MDKALDLITERTNGDVTFSRTYSGTLGSEHDLGVMCQSGDIDIVCIGPGQWSDWDEAFKVFDCPFLFTSFDRSRFRRVSGLAQGARRRAGRDLRDDLQPGVQGHPEQEPRCVFHR